MAHNDALQQRGIKCRGERDTDLTFLNGGFSVAASPVKYEEDNKLHLSCYFARAILQLVKQNTAK